MQTFNDINGYRVFSDEWGDVICPTPSRAPEAVLFGDNEPQIICKRGHLHKLEHFKRVLPNRAISSEDLEQR